MVDILKPEEMFKSIDYTVPSDRWEDVPTDLSEGKFCYPTKKKNQEYLGLVRKG